MRFSTEPRWRKAFALLPVRITGTETEVWLEWYWELDYPGSTHPAIETRLWENPPETEYAPR